MAASATTGENRMFFREEAVIASSILFRAWTAGLMLNELHKNPRDIGNISFLKQVRIYFFLNGTQDEIIIAAPQFIVIISCFLMN